MVNWDHHIMQNYTVNIYRQNDATKTVFDRFGPPKTTSRAISWLKTKNATEARIEIGLYMFDHVSSQSWGLKNMSNALFSICWKKRLKLMFWKYLWHKMTQNGHNKKWPLVNKGPKVFRGVISQAPYPKVPIERQEKKIKKKTSW